MIESNNLKKRGNVCFSLLVDRTRRNQMKRYMIKASFETATNSFVVELELKAKQLGIVLNYLNNNDYKILSIDIV